MEYIRKTARYNGKKYEATGKTEIEAMSCLLYTSCPAR